MRIVGFNFTKMHAERNAQLTDTNINNRIEFTDLEKESADILKDGQAVKLAFRYSLDYEKKSEGKEKGEKQAEVSFEGSIILSVDKNEAKEFQKSWKKKQVPKDKVSPLYNFILKKCSTKAILLQEEINLPSPYLKIPQVRPQE